MINIASLPKPDVMQVLDYEEILQQNITDFKALLPEWIPLESDAYKLMLEAFAYRELHLRAEFNNLASAFFLSTSTKNDLDNYAVFYNVIRLDGSYPYAAYEFSLDETLTQDVVIPANLILTDENSEYQGKLLNAVTIFAGETKVTGTVELQVEVQASDVKTEIITTPLPFVIQASAKNIFLNGSSVESDEEFKQRILLSMADKSTAGSEETYKSFTFNADERIEDVAVLNGGAGIVNVFYYSEEADALMQSRIEEMLNKESVRPLSDNLQIALATVVPFNVVARLEILPHQETATIFSNALKNLTAKLEKLKRIGTKITLSEINNFLTVDGVKEVVITSPTSNVEIANNEIGVNGANTITYTII